MTDPTSSPGERPPIAYQLRDVEPRIVIELRQLAAKLMEDGVLTDEEALQLRQWLVGHSEVLDYPLGDRLCAKLIEVYADQILEPNERAQVEALLRGAAARLPR